MTSSKLCLYNPQRILGYTTCILLRFFVFTYVSLSKKVFLLPIKRKKVTKTINRKPENTLFLLSKDSERSRFIGVSPKMSNLTPMIA